MLGFFRNLLGPAKGAEVPGTLEGGGGLVDAPAQPPATPSKPAPVIKK